MKLLYVSTTVQTPLRFLEGQNRYMREHGFELHALAAPAAEWTELAERDQLQAHPLPIARGFAPLHDLLTIWRMFRLFRQLQPDLLHLSTPKAAVLGALAGWLAKIPARVFLVRNTSIENARGLRMLAARWLERLTVQLCHRTIAVSHSLRTLLESEKILPPGECIVIGQGMSNGVDVRRYDPERVTPFEITSLLPESVHIPEPVVVGCVGRLAFDKGLAELAATWQQLREEFPAAVLLLCGEWDSSDQRVAPLRNQLATDPRVIQVGVVNDLERYLAAMDVLVFPSHGREGFPNAPMAAAAMGVPLIVSDVTGCVDTVADGETGQIVPCGDAAALTAALRAYLNSPEIRAEHGRHGRQRVLDHFQREHIWSGLYAVYHELLSEVLPPARLRELRQPMVFGLTDEPELPTQSTALPPDKPGVNQRD